VTSAEHIVAEAARAQGFALAGFAAIRRLREREDFYRGWLDAGRHGAMEYLARAPERRFDPRTLDPRLKSVVSLGYPYAAPAYPRLDWRAELRGRIAAYALGPDYHDRVLTRARAVATAIEALRPGAVTRVYVDTGPVFEREWAAEARLGWFGKNTTLLSRDQGSYFFLAEIFTDAEFAAATEPYREHCGTCRRCLDLCPTNALGDGFVMEPRVCISYLTIENRGAIPPELRARLGNWIFGCDICQEVCPWNESLRPPAAADLSLAPHLPELLALDADAFSRRFSKSAVKRAHRRGLLRNVAVVLGNTRNRDAAAALATALEAEPEPLVRSHAAWALGEVGGAAAQRALERALGRDDDREVRREASAALDSLCP
jgi:epoxyqueuosine reductase